MSLGHDCIKYWSATPTGSGLELSEIKRLSNWHCGLQSYEISKDGNNILLVGIDSTLREINLDKGNEPLMKEINKGLMEIWFARFSPDRENYLTSKTF